MAPTDSTNSPLGLPDGGDATASQSTGGSVARSLDAVAVGVVERGSTVPVDLAPSGPFDGAPVAVLLVVVLAGIHVGADRLAALGVVPRSRALSIAGGASVAYVFVHVLPQLDDAGTAIDRGPPALAAVQEHVYLVTLAGFVAYYGLEQFVRRSSEAAPDGAAPPGVFWFHIGAFAAYDALIGYLLFHREAPGVGEVLPFGVAMALHFLVNDYGLRAHHEDDYRRVGRWVLAGAVVTGAAAGVVTGLAPSTLGVLFAFLAGGVVLNAIKEELPTERESGFWAFAAGAGAYAAVPLVT